MSSKNRELTSSVKVAIHAVALATGIENQNRRMAREEIKKATEPSMDFPKKGFFPTYLPIIDARGSDMERTKRAAIAGYLSKMRIVRREERIKKKLPVGF